MKEIKIKAWNPVLQKMIDLKSITPLALNSDFKCDGLFIPFIEGLILLQYTGMDCDNGQNIYDGDFVGGTYTEGSGPEQVSYPSIGLVSWSDMWGKWIITDMSKASFDLYDFEPLEYISGNIYENPDMMNPKKDIKPFNVDILGFEIP